MRIHFKSQGQAERPIYLTAFCVDILPDTRFRIIYLYLPYPAFKWGPFLDQWCNETAQTRGRAAVPKLWMFPAATGILPDLVKVIDKYDGLALAPEVYTTYPLQVSISNTTRRFGKLFCLSFTLEGQLRLMQRAVASVGGKVMAILHNAGDVYELNGVAAVNITSSETQVQVVAFASVGMGNGGIFWHLANAPILMQLARRYLT